MFSNCRRIVYFNESNVIEIFIFEVNMSSVFFILRSLNFLSTDFLVGNLIFLFGNVKEDLGTIEFCSPKLNFSSGSNLNNVRSSTPSDIA